MAATSRTRILLALLVSGRLGLGALLVAPAASAHDRVLSTSPSDKDALAASPSEITVVFNNDIQPRGATIAVRTISTPVELGATVVDGPVMRASLPALPPGTYITTYRAIGSDGHPISGGLTFTVDPSAPAADSGGFPLRPLLLGSLLVVVLGVVGLLVVRRRSP